MTTADRRTDYRSRSHLVVDGRNARIDMWLEAAALVLGHEGKSRRMHPVRRVDRVTVIGDVRLQADALAALAQTGTPLGVLNGSGQLKALLMPCNRRRSSLADQLNRLTRHPDWPDRIEDWRRCEISLHARALRQSDPAHAARIGWAGAEQIIVAAAPSLSRAQTLRLKNRAHSFAELLAQRCLRDAGCPAGWLGADPDPEHNIAPVFGQIVLWRLARYANTARGTRTLRRALRRDAETGLHRIGGAVLAETAELAAAALRRAVLADLRRFHRHLLELNASAAYLPASQRRS